MIGALSSVAGVSASLANAGEAAVGTHPGGLAGGSAGASGAGGTHGLSLSSEPGVEAAGGVEGVGGAGQSGLEGVGGGGATGGEAPSGVEGTGGSGGFGEALTSAISSLEQTQQSASGAAQALATGSVSDPEAAVVTVEEAQLAMQLASQIRTKATEAVQQVFQTQV